MEELFRYLSSLAPLPAELQAALVSRTSKEFYRRNKTILPVGQVCDWVGFVESGLVKVGYDVPGGEERIILFATGGTPAFSVGSFTTGLPSRMAIVTIEETIIRKIRKAAVDELCSRFPVFHLHVRKLVEAQTLFLEDHYLRLTVSQRERYLQLVRSGSWMLSDKRIKDYMAAAYLGIDRATFSRFRNGR